MQGFYFDYQILEGDAMNDAERKLRLRLQRKISALEALAEMSARRGLYYATADKKERVEKAYN